MPAGIPPRRLARTAVSSDTDSDGKYSTAANTAAKVTRASYDAIPQAWNLCPADSHNWTALHGLSALPTDLGERRSGTNANRASRR